MKFQKNLWSCGPASIVNALRALGKKVSELKVRGYSSTDQDDGTNENGMVEAIRCLGFSASEFQSSDKEAMRSWIMTQVGDGKPVIVCVNEWDHWVTIVGLLGDSFVVVDSTNTKQNKSENGCHVWSKRYLLTALWNSDDSKLEEGDERMYGIAVGKK